ncbi:MAG: hypothetical protein JNN01_03945 [Opitutaceae bacterium]|nr:hypothetical protein [Opitutaceae bacterium]
MTRTPYFRRYSYYSAAVHSSFSLAQIGAGCRCIGSPTLARLTESFCAYRPSSRLPWDFISMLLVK